MCDLIILGDSRFVRRHFPHPLPRRRQFSFATSLGITTQETLLVKNEAKEVCLKSHGGQANSLVTGKRGTLLLVFKMGRKQDPRSYRLVSLILVLGKILEQILMEATFRPIQGKEVN